MSSPESMERARKWIDGHKFELERDGMPVPAVVAGPRNVASLAALLDDAKNERDALESQLAAQVASQAIAEREVIALQASVSPDGVAPESYAKGYRAGLERAAQAVRDAGGDNEDYHVDAIRALSAPALGETP